MTPEQLIARVDQARDFVTGCDGYIVYWPEGLNGGLSADALRTIADELDRRNAAWDAQVKEDLNYLNEQMEFENWIMGDFEV